MKNPMHAVYDTFGGRKVTMIVVAMVLVALKNQLSLDDKSVELIVWLALGGSGAVALESAAQSLRGKK